MAFTSYALTWLFNFADGIYTYQNIIELKQGPQQRERHKTIGLMSKNNNSARFARAFYISAPSSAKQQREMIKINGLSEER